MQYVTSSHERYSGNIPPNQQRMWKITSASIFKFVRDHVCVVWQQ